MIMYLFLSLLPNFFVPVVFIPNMFLPLDSFTLFLPGLEYCQPPRSCSLVKAVEKDGISVGTLRG